MDCAKLTASQNLAHSYFENHIVLEKCGDGIGTRGRYTKWLCLLNGERVGEIEYSENPYRAWDKQYSACVLYDCKHDRMNHIGGYDTLIEAKIAVLKEGRKLLSDELAKREKETTPAAFLPDTDFQFYPTPSNVAGELMACIDWKNVKTVLEPSAGRGDLIEWAKRLNSNLHFNMNGHRKSYSRDIDDIDCIEIDPNLRAMLIGKGYRVVHDDFLDFYTRKRYDLILMNPPFADGDVHLLHALELMEHGGQIACILNAETIRNPYSNRRKALLKELHRYEASIRFVDGGFKKSARKTDVEIALVNIAIPKADTDTSIWDDMKKAREAHLEAEGLNEVAPANQVERLIREYDLLCEAGITMMQKYNGIAPRIHGSRMREYSQPIISLYVGGHMCDKLCQPGDINKFLYLARSRYWRELFDLPELREQMTSAMKEEYSHTISEMADYEFSMFNIQQVIKKIKGQLVLGVEEAIVKCFDKLSAEHSYNKDVQNENVHYYNGWKTNKAHYVNMKCIIPTYGCFAKGYKADIHGHWKDTLEGLDVRGCFQTLDDLEKALDYLDKGETVPTSLETVLQTAAQAGRTTVECKYFTVTFYKKGTCHIKFHDQKIVDRLNICVGRQRAWLPPSYGKARYEEMDEESKRVVDEFQGSEKYAEVLSNPTDYIIEAEATPLLLA